MCTCICKDDLLKGEVIEFIGTVAVKERFNWIYTHFSLYLLYIKDITIRTPGVYSQVWLLIEH